MDTAGTDEVLAAMYADAYVAGTKTALDQLGGAVVRSDYSRATSEINWDTWKPGHPAAAAQMAADDSGSGLARLLAQRGITIRGVEGTRLDQLGQLLADALTRGDSVQTLAKAIADLTGDPAQADLIATTEVNRAMTLASLDLYAQSGITQWDWLTASDPCAACSDEEQGNPHQMGDDEPPGHPRCQCAVSPVVTMPDGSTFEEF